MDQERKQLNRIGTRKVHYQIQEQLQAAGLKWGRDKLFELMREYNLLIKPERRYVQTTMSKHWMRKWPNLIKKMEVTAPDQVWVSDITYIKTREGNCFLNMITDAYSRKIVGYAVDSTMETNKMIQALVMAIGQKSNTGAQTIHHSDRGLQYCSKEYARLTAQHQIRLSMTENGDPYENALAERMNRTMKEEFTRQSNYLDIQQVKQLVQESVILYNTRRPHLALKMKTPQEVYITKNPRQLNVIGEI